MRPTDYRCERAAPANNVGAANFCKNDVAEGNNSLLSPCLSLTFFSRPASTRGCAVDDKPGMGEKVVRLSFCAPCSAKGCGHEATSCVNKSTRGAAQALGMDAKGRRMRSRRLARKRRGRVRCGRIVRAMITTTTAATANQPQR